MSRGLLPFYPLALRRHRLAGALRPRFVWVLKHGRRGRRGNLDVIHTACRAPRRALHTRAKKAASLCVTMGSAGGGKMAGDNVDAVRHLVLAMRAQPFVRLIALVFSIVGIAVFFRL